MAENVSFDALIDKISPAVFAVGDDKNKREGKKGKGRYQKVTKRYISAICGVGTSRPIPIKFGMRVVLHNVINMSNFCNKIFRDFRSTGSQNPRFPINYAGHRYNSAAW